VAERGEPVTPEQARAVLSMRPLIWVGTGIGAVCLVLALSSWNIGRQNGNDLLTWVAPVFFLLVAGAWVAGVRRLRSRVAAARALLGDTEGTGG
jgi:fatty acid desaturase